MAYQVIDCGVFCIGDIPGTADANTGGDVFIGMIYFSVLLALVVFDVLLIINTHMSTYRYTTSELKRPILSNDEQNNTSDSVSRKHIRDSDDFVVGQNSVSQVIRYNFHIMLAFLVFFPVMFLACMTLPNNWQYLSLSGIRSYEEYSHDSDPPLKDEYGTCFTLKIYDNYVLKLFPDILIFYAFLYSFVFVGLLSQVYPPLRRFLHSRFHVMGNTFYHGECIAGLALVLLLIGEFLYWYYDHWYQNLPYNTISRVEVAARSMGQLGNVLAGLLLLPVAKNSIWSPALGISWEGMMLYHNYLGRLFLIVTFIHAMLFLKVIDMSGFLPHDILGVPPYYHGDNFTIPLAMAVGLFMFILMGIGTVWHIRRSHHELFYWTHHFSMVVFLMMLWHASMAWYYITPGLILWAIDHTMRLNNCLGIQVNVQKVEIEGNGNIVCLGYTVSAQHLLQPLMSFFWPPRINSHSLNHKMGQYCYINIPAISAFEWHPFSISSSPLDSVTTHHIKMMGSDQWTGKFLEMAAGMNIGTHENTSKLIVNIDGPYGLNVPIRTYSRLCLIAGGIGITPLHSYLRHIYMCMREAQGKLLSYDDNGFTDTRISAKRSSTTCAFSHLKQVRLIWLVSSEAESLLFDKTIQAIENDNLGGIFSYAIYITRGKLTGATAWRSGTFQGRPDLGAEIADFAKPMSSHSPSTDKNYDSLVFACGPQALVEVTSDLTISMGVDFKHETFEL